ncbi:JNK1/MAPK8-associated membrane protein isoform X1 [Grammomys surdaster]|uniref:JNK1/MAPK8-associated membrane protein isoform X1 n=1 Tax=Grammomys surdaster TaxID=491861 RepID=UPI0010A015D2|nr:JNK1/MAPK8-associated membrane protein isoform X1 [Grammomys surdaster]
MRKPRFLGILGLEVSRVHPPTPLLGEAVVGRDSEPNVAGAGFQRDCPASRRRSGRERCGPDVRALRLDRLIPASLGNLEWPMAVDIQPACLGLYCGKTLLFKNGSSEVYGECGVCPRGQRTNAQKYCQPCTESPELYDWLYLGFMAMLPLVLHWFFIEWYSGKKSSSALFQHITALFECTMAAIITLLVSDPVGVLYIRSCRVLMLSDWYTMLYNPSPDYVTTVHCTHEAVYPLYTIVFVYYAFCLVLMMLLRPLLVKKIACGLGKSDRFKSIYAALYFFPILTVLQAVGGGLLYYAFPYIILVLSLVTLAVYMSASEIENCYDLLVRKKRLIVLFSHWLLHAYGIVSISRVDRLEHDLPLLALVPTPALFYLFTAKFTEPSRILSEGANGH